MDHRFQPDHEAHDRNHVLTDFEINIEKVRHIEAAVIAGVPPSHKEAGNPSSLARVALSDGEQASKSRHFRRKGIARRVDVSVGPRMNDRISVTKGLTAGQQIAVDGVTALEDGMKVRTK